MPPRRPSANPLRTSRRGFARGCVAGLALLALLALATAAPAAGISREYQLKAGFLYNFTKFVEWPEACFPPGAPLVLGVLGRNPFGDELEKAVAGRTAGGRAIVVRGVAGLEDARKVHLLFAPAGETAGAAELLQALRGLPVLTVGEADTFRAAGGMILFTVSHDKLRFEINIAAAQRAGLKVSAQLQKLATAVRK